MAFTFANAIQFLEDYDKSNIGTKGGRIYKKIANDANMELHRSGKFSFDRRISTITFAAPYSTGTVSVAVDGTTVTGVGTTFTAAMVGGYIRFAGEALSYEITARASNTSITIGEAYHGSAALSGATFVITFDRAALPTRFRDFEKPVISAGIYQLRPTSLHEMILLRQQSPVSGTPYVYTTEEAEVSSVPTKYMWVYPAPSRKMTLTFAHYVWASELTADADLFRIPYEGEGALREMMLALLKREQGQSDWQAQFNIARSVFQDVCGASRLVSEDLVREEYHGDCDDDYRTPNLATPTYI